MTIGDVEVIVTLSIGVAIIRPGEDVDFDGLLSRADAALASARGAGGNRTVLDRSQSDEPAVDKGPDPDRGGSAGFRVYDSAAAP